MCNLSKGIEAKGMAKGMVEGMAKGMVEGMAKGMVEGRAKGMVEGVTNGILSSIRNLVKNMGVSVEQAMTVLEVPEAERQKYMDLLEKR